MNPLDATAAGVRGEFKGRASRALTQRELSVLKIASDGNTAEEIASAQDLRKETVRTHFKKARTKLRARNRTHAVAEAMRQLLIV